MNESAAEAADRFLTKPIPIFFGSPDEWGSYSSIDATKSDPLTWANA